MTIFYGVCIVILGLIFGSFLSVLVYRLPRGESVVIPRSHCVNCNALVRWHSNIPLASWILQRGKCKDCGKGISVMYPLIEFSTALIFFLIFYKYGISVLAAKYLMFAFLLLGAAYTDLFTSFDKENFECGMIPDIYTIGGVLAGYAWSFFTPGFTFMESLAGSGAGVFVLLIVVFLYGLISGVEGMGMGDALLMGMVGSFLGPKAILFVVTLSAFSGALIGIVVVYITKNRRYMLPFAPMIALGAIVYLMFDEYFVSFIGI